MSGKPTSHKSCCIPKCRLTGKPNDTDDKKISYHTFPFDETESLAWLKSICAADKSHIELFPNSRVCSRHFTDDDYVPNLPNGRIRLKPGAVPTVFEWTTMNGCEMDENTGATLDDVDSTPAGFTVHVARRKAREDISAKEAAVASSAIAANLNPQNTGLDLTSTSNAYIALQSPQGLAIANNASQGSNSVEVNSIPMEEGPRLETLQQQQCINCSALETEISRASVELTNLQREKVLLHAKCAELEEEVQKIHVYCKQLKALNDHLQMVTAVEREEKAQRVKKDAELAAMAQQLQQQQQQRQQQQQQQQQQQDQSTQSPQLSPQLPTPQTAAPQMSPASHQVAMIGKGRRKQSNPMKRPRENDTNSHLSNGDINQSKLPDGTNSSQDEEHPGKAKIPALDATAADNHTSEHQQVESTDAATQTTIEGTDISGMKDENDLLSGVLTDERRLHRTLFVKSILTTNENVKTFTGIPTKEGLEVLFEVLMDPEMMNLHWQARPGDTLMAAQKKAYMSVNRRGMSTLSPFHDFLITLIRLNLGLKHVVLSSLFGCSTAKTSTVCRSWIEYMRGVRENTMIGKLLAHLPLDVQKSERVEQHMISLPPLVSETQWIAICRSFLDRHKNIKTEADKQPDAAGTISPKLSPGTSLGIKVKESKTGAGLVLENYHSQIKRESRKGSAQINAALQNPLPPLAIKQEPGLQQAFNPHLLNQAAAQGVGNGMMYLLANGCVVQDYSKLALTVPQFQNQLLPVTTMTSIPPSLQALAQVGITTPTPTIDLSEATAAKAEGLEPKVVSTASTEDIARAFGIEAVGGLIPVDKSEPQTDM